MAKKNEKNKTLQWVLGIGIAIMLFFMVSIAIDLTMPHPDWSDFCTDAGAGQVCAAELYNSATAEYEFKIFMILSVLGVVLVIGSLFITQLLFVEVAMMIAGIGFMIMGIVRNFGNKLQVLLSLIVMVALLVFVGIKKLKR